MMTDLLPDLGNPTMMSMEIFVEMDDGMARGWKVPGGLINSPLLR